MPAWRALSQTVRAALGLSPIIPVLTLAGVCLVVMAASNGGYFPTDWYPAALFMLGLLVVAALAVPRSRPPSRAVHLGLALLAGYAAWSCLSIAWAAQKGDAWDGANRTAFYAVVFALFALWPVRARPAAVLVGAVALLIAAIGLVELLRAAGAADPSYYFIDGRFARPIGYANADAALWSSAFWPCVILGSRRETSPALRAVLAGAAVLLAGLALMGQSRGWLFALPVVAVVYLLVTPRRVRTVLTTLLVLAGTGVTIPSTLAVYDKTGRPLADAMSSAAATIVSAAVVTGALAGLAGIGDRRYRVSPAAGRRAAAALATAGAVAFVIGAVVYVGARGSPFTDIAHAWNQFKTHPTPHGGSSRLGRLGSNRYDFWRVAWGRFRAQPVRGIGADNFQEAYLRLGHSREQPRYPHSVELRTLSQTGIVGAALLAAALTAALCAALRGIRRRRGVGAAAAASGVVTFGYWLVHGSVDWFWEFPALGALAFAVLGMAAGLAPRGARPPRGPGRAAVHRRVPAVAAVVVALVVAASFAGPWLSERYVSQAERVWPAHPARALENLDSAAALDPLSAHPKLVAASIALRLGRRRDAERYFRQALDRDPGDSYSRLELGALAIDSGRRSEGVALLASAHRLDPRDQIVSAALSRARRGGAIDIAAMNQRILTRARRLGR
ncbi:MAG: O-antigen ligase family protein [Actinobacteria bacterium]|nr:O-antigen ligase family protein [Actinomycetota bacterium]